jgi:hypothetical protein
MIHRSLADELADDPYPFHTAVIEGDKIELKKLIAQARVNGKLEEKLNEKDESNNTPISLAKDFIDNKIGSEIHQMLSSALTSAVEETKKRAKEAQQKERMEIDARNKAKKEAQRQEAAIKKAQELQAAKLEESRAEAILEARQRLQILAETQFETLALLKQNLNNLNQNLIRLKDLGILDLVDVNIVEKTTKIPLIHKAIQLKMFDLAHNLMDCGALKNKELHGFFTEEFFNFILDGLIVDGAPNADLAKYLDLDIKIGSRVTHASLRQALGIYTSATALLLNSSSTKAFEIMLDYGADIDYSGTSEVMIAPNLLALSFEARQKEFAKILLKRGANLKDGLEFFILHGKRGLGFVESNISPLLLDILSSSFLNVEQKESLSTTFETTLNDVASAREDLKIPLQTIASQFSKRAAEARESSAKSQGTAVAGAGAAQLDSKALKR